MKIRLAVLDGDVDFLRRLSAALTGRYPDKVEVYTFTDADAAMRALSGSGIGVFLADEDFEIDAGAIPARCGFAYLTDDGETEQVRGRRAVCRYRGLDVTLREILGIYAEVAAGTGTAKGAACPVFVFASPCGGAGSSTAAAAMAISAARRGKKALYINAERFGDTSAWFNGPGSGTLSDVIYAVKSGKGNLRLKAESAVRTADNGACFIASCPAPMDVTELTAPNVEALLDAMTTGGAWDCVIVDAELAFSEAALTLFRRAEAIVMTSDGSGVSSARLDRALAAFDILEKKLDIVLSGKVRLLYNKFPSRGGVEYAGRQMTVLGGAPRFEGAGPERVAAELAALSVFDKLI